MSEFYIPATMTINKFKELISNHNEKSESYKSLLSSIYYYNETPDKYIILDLILNKIVNENGEDLGNHDFMIGSLLNKVIRRDDLYMFDILVKYGYPIDGAFNSHLNRRISQTPIKISIKEGFVDIVDYIISHGGEVTYQDLILSIRYNAFDIFLHLLDTHIDYTNKDIIFDCIMEYQDFDVYIVPYLEKLIAVGFDVNIKPENEGISALFSGAVEPGTFYEILEILIKSGADVNSYDYIDENSHTLITLLLNEENNIDLEKSIDLLLAHGADIHIHNELKGENNLQLLEEKYPHLYTKYFNN